MSDAPKPPSSRRPDDAPGSADPDQEAASEAPEPDDADRVAEAGNAYVGRTLDDGLKSSDRLTEPGEGLADDEA